MRASRDFLFARFHQETGLQAKDERTPFDDRWLQFSRLLWQFSVDNGAKDPGIRTVPGNGKKNQSGISLAWDWGRVDVRWG